MKVLLRLLLSHIEKDHLERNSEAYEELSILIKSIISYAGPRRRMRNPYSRVQLRTKMHIGSCFARSCVDLTRF